MERSIKKFFQEEENQRWLCEIIFREDNLYCLREKLFSMEGYLRQRDVEEELAKVSAEKRQIAEAWEKKHEIAMTERAEEHRREIKAIKAQYAKALQEKEEELAAYQASVRKELCAARANEEQLARWESGYSELAAAFGKFTKLSPKHREGMAGIFGGCDTPLEFLCGSVQERHLKQLWDYVRDEIYEQWDEQEAELLSSLFDFSFAAVNRSQCEPLYERLAALQGSRFDGDTMGRTAGSPQNGRVKRVVFAGFAHKITGSVVCRSLVELE